MYKIDYDAFSTKYKDIYYNKVSHNIRYYIDQFIDGKSYQSKNVMVKATSKNTINLLNKLKGDAFLKKIILGSLLEMHEIIKEMPDKAFCQSNKKGDNLNLILYRIFVVGCYEGKTIRTAYTTEEINSGDYVEGNCINNIEHINQLNLKTCPYCNRNYIFSVKINRKKNSNIIDVNPKPQLDHFFPKSAYPFLGASLYNLIPSCSFCNGLEVKGEIEPIKNKKNPESSELIMNPYEFEDIKFSFSYKLSSIDILNLVENDIDILYKGAQQYIDGYQYIFGTQSLYNGHKDIILDLIRKYEIYYPKSNQEYINKIFNNDNEDFFYINNKVINHIFFGFEKSSGKHHQKSFSKFMNDIFKVIMDDKILNNNI